MSFTIAIIGRPNVGKSTLFNRLVGKKLALVDDLPGVTRDRRPGDAKLVDLTLRIFDTAGMRRRARVTEKLEKLSVADALRAVRFAETVIIVFDATIPFEKQDLH